MAPLSARQEHGGHCWKGHLQPLQREDDPLQGVERQPACVAVLRDGPVLSEELPRLAAQERLGLLALVEGDPVPAFQEPRRDQSEVWTKPEVQVERIADREGGLVLELCKAPRRFRAWRCTTSSPGLPPASGSVRRSAATARPRITAQTTSA